MIARYTRSIYSWFWRAAETVLAWLKQHGPAVCEKGLDKLQSLQVGPIVGACIPYMRGPAYLLATVLVIYFLATMSIVDFLILFALFLGLVLVLDKFSDRELQVTT